MGFVGEEPSPARSRSATMNASMPMDRRRTAQPAGAEAALATARSRELPAAWWLGALVVVSAAVRFAIARAAPAPAIFPDEMIYAELARSFGDSGHFLVRDAPFGAWTYGPLYPVLLAP